LFEELGEEATVSVAEDQGAFLLEEIWQEVEAAVLEGSGKGQVFEPAIGASYVVEVRFSREGR
jgi:hypothetical protein